MGKLITVICSHCFKKISSIPFFIGNKVISCTHCDRKSVVMVDDFGYIKIIKFLKKQSKFETHSHRQFLSGYGYW